MSTKIISSFICTLILVASVNTFAAKVLQLKNGKVLIDLEGDTATPNQQGVLINADNKRVAIVLISQVKNGKAIGMITKGQAQGTESVKLIIPKDAASGSSGPAESASPANQVFRTKAKKMSLVASLMSNSMTTKQSTNDTVPIFEDVDMKGSTFGLTGIVDWPVGPSFDIRGTFGYEPFKTTGTAVRNVCDMFSGTPSTNCTADITYLSAGGYGRYNFNQSRAQFWAALGGTLKFPMAKSTTALKPDDIKMTMTYGLAAGLDYFISNKSFIPVSLEQQMFLKSDTVSASVLFIRLGYGQTF